MTAADGIEPGGLDLASPDAVSAEELARFRQFYSDTKGSQNKSYEFWLEFAPDVVKRHKARTVQWYLGEQTTVQVLSMIHQYTIRGFAEGIEYEMQLARRLGSLRTDVLDTLSIAFIHSGHPGMYEATLTAPLLRNWVPEPVDRPRFPAAWAFDRDAFRSGMDFETLECTPDDIAALRSWYLDVAGEVPAHVEVMAKYRKDLLKAYRNRYEHAIRESLPAQMMPYLGLHYNVYRGFDGGIRENILLARALGLTREQVLNAIFSAVLHGGANVLDTVARIDDGLIDSFPEAAANPAR
jgi:hypothetical protein